MQRYRSVCEVATFSTMSMVTQPGAMFFCALSQKYLSDLSRLIGQIYATLRIYI